MIPEIDSSKLNISSLQPMSPGYQTINVFHITITTMEIDPADLLATSSTSTTCINASLDIDILLARLDQSARKIAV